MLLNQSVHGLIKVQDIVNRLLHESLGGDLVDTSRPDWERTQLTHANVDEGLKAKCARGAISQAEFDAITHALAIPKNTPRADIANSYRNRLKQADAPYPAFCRLFDVLLRAGVTRRRRGHGRAREGHRKTLRRVFQTARSIPLRRFAGRAF